MNRRHLALIILMNAVISLAISVTVVWVADARRPDTEELAALAGVASLSSGSGGGLTVDLPPVATSVQQVAPTLEESAGEDAPAGEPETSPETASAASEPEIYTVQAGESLGAIADKLGVTVLELVEANNLANPDFVFSGQQLIIPGSVPTATATPEGVALGTTGLKVRNVNAPGNLAEEFVEIINDTDLSFNLQGWKLQRSGGPEYTFGDLLVFPGGQLRLHSTEGTNTTIARYWGQTAPVWGSGATVRLINAQGEAVTEYSVP